MRTPPRGTRVRVALGAALVALLSSCAPKPSAFTPDLIGSWQGTISIEARKLSILVHFLPDGTARMDILSADSAGADSNTMSFPLKDVAFRPPRVDFALSAGSDLAVFRGEMTGARIQGSFEQAGHRGTFSLAKSGVSARIGPAQSGINVVLRTATGDLHGSLLLPASAGAVPVVLIVAAAEGMDRNGNVPAAQAMNDCLLLYAADLAARGIASLRYDQRGVGASAPALKPGESLLFSTLVDDAASWLTNLKRDKRFDRVAVVGYGQGTLVAMAAAARVGVDAVVLISGPGEPADALMKRQLSGEPNGLRDAAFRVIDRLKAGKEVSGIPPSLSALFGRAEQPYLISKFRYDPQAEIAKLTMPVLVVQGTSDLELGAEEAELLHKANPRSFLDLIRGMNHVLRMVSSDNQANVASYNNPNLPISAELVQVTAEFLRLSLGLPLQGAVVTP